MNDKGIRSAICERIDAMPLDSAFTVTVFADVSDSANTRQALKALTDSGQLVRASRGVYYKPRYSKLLRQTVPPDVDEVANAVARARGWTIAPSGVTALNRIGLDTQVPATYTYVSSGPYVSLLVGKHEVRQALGEQELGRHVACDHARGAGSQGSWKGARRHR